jgi:hypothetical protein
LFGDDVDTRFETFSFQLLNEEPLCLDPSFQVTRVANAIQYAQRDKQRKKKRKLNSYELAARRERKAENETLMALMDEVCIF